MGGFEVTGVALSVLPALIRTIEFSNKIIRKAELRQNPLRPSFWLVGPGPSTRDIANGISAGIKELEAVAAYLLPISNADGELSNDRFATMVAESIDQLKTILPAVIRLRNMAPVLDWQKEITLESIQDTLSRLSTKILDVM